MFEQRLAELQAKSGQAENKWEARVKEYENRLRIAGEKIKTEKQGGKERARELEAQVRYVDCIFVSTGPDGGQGVGDTGRSGEEA